MGNAISINLSIECLRYLGKGMRVLSVGGLWENDINRKIINPDLSSFKLTLDSVDLGPRSNSQPNGSGGTSYHVTHECYNKYPMEDEKYDIIVNHNVLEHADNPWMLFMEWGRICKNGGRIITSAPFMEPPHPNPSFIDGWRFLPDGLRSLYESCGFKVEICELRDRVRKIDPFSVRSGGQEIHFHLKKEEREGVRPTSGGYNLQLCFAVGVKLRSLSAGQ